MVKGLKRVETGLGGEDMTLCRYLSLFCAVVDWRRVVSLHRGGDLEGIRKENA